jgi:hypothetical protein
VKPGPPTLLLLVACLLWGSFGHAAAQNPKKNDGPDLDTLATQVKKAREADYASVVAQLEKAAATPQTAQAFFFECVQKLDFKRDLEVPAKFENWKRDFMAQWRGHELGVVLQMQLQYQALVIRTAVDKTARPKLVPQWLRFAELIVDHAKDASYGAAFLAQPVNASIFNKALKLQQLGGAEGFSVGALDIGRIFDTHIHPYVKKENRASAWQRHIELQTKFAETILLATELDDFDTFELPRLEWRAIVDVKLADGGKDPAAMKEAMTFIQQHLHHPDAMQWVEALRTFTKGKEKEQ